MAWDYGQHWTELQANASHFEVQSSKPDDATARTIWIGWAACAVLSTLSSAISVTVMFSSKKVRTSIFNIYLIVLLSSDFFMSFNYAITCLLNVANGGYFGRAMCEFQGFYMMFSMGCSFYINLLIAHEVFRLLSATKRLQPYTPPSRRVVLLRCLGVLLPCAIVSSLGAWRVLPHESRLMRGVLCLPTASGTIGKLSPLLLPIILPLLAYIPTVLALALAAVSWRRKLLNFEQNKIANASSKDLHARAVHRHRVQQTQMLTIYFARIYVVLLLWYPAIGFMLLTVHSPAPTAIGVVFVFVQSLVSAAMSLTIRDVKEAATGLFRRLTCQRTAFEPISISARSKYHNQRTPPVGNTVYNSEAKADIGWHHIYS
eukprot:scaffold22423_cov120-Isochrysis_galbana.AAC.3